MKVSRVLLEARLALEKATADFLDACATLKLVAASSGQLVFENSLDNILSSIDSTTVAESHICESRIILKKLLNTSTTRVPAHKLPVETLGYIFSIVAASSPCHPTDKQRDTLLDIPQVCVRWNRVAVDTPSLWSHVDIDLSRFSVATALERARLWLNRCHNMPIHLHLDGSSRLEFQSVVPDIFTVMRCHGGSLGSLVFTNTSHDSLVRALLGLVSSPLQALVISEVTTPRFVLGVPSSLPIGLLRGLTTLHLIGPESSRPIYPSLGDVAKVLSGSPALHTLRLRHLDFPSGSLQTQSAIPLPQLRFLEVSDVCGDEVPLLFSKLAPGVLELDVRLNAEYFGDGRLESPAQQLLARSNVISLSIYCAIYDLTQQLIGCLPLVPRLRVLQLHSMSLTKNFAMALATRVDDQPPLQLSFLRSLCLLGCAVDSWVADSVEQIIARIRLHSLAFLNCSFPPSFTRPINRNQESELTLYDSDVDYSNYQDEMPQNMRGWFSARVQRVVVDTSRTDQTYYGVDPFVQKLI